MERNVPDMLRAYADALEDKRRVDNIESCRRFPEYDQKMLLALNDMPSVDQLPDAGTILKQLRHRLISITSADGQGASLGLFYTNADPFNIKKARPAVGIFPLYSEITNYHLRPNINLYLWQSQGKFTIIDESAPGTDPFIVPNSEGPDFMFFRQSPFSEAQPYKTSSQENPKAILTQNPKLHEEALEQNVIERALWFENVANRKAYLFKQKGFDTFIRENRRDPRYSELYAAFRRSHGSYFGMYY